MTRAAICRLALLLSAMALSAAGWAAPERGPIWASLSAEQQRTLAPLQRDWASLEPDRKQKWLEVAARFRTMPPDERERVRQRMAEWARLSPAERSRAREQFKQARQLTSGERQAKWQAYQALPAEERRKLAQEAKPAPRPAPPQAAAPRPRTAANDKRGPAAGAAAAAAQPVGPIVVQAKPGATTTTLSTKRPTAPSHSQPGLPKIAATPGFVDPATLLPLRGPQGAAVATERPAQRPPERPATSR